MSFSVIVCLFVVVCLSEATFFLRASFVERFFKDGLRIYGRFSFVTALHNKTKHFGQIFNPKNVKKTVKKIRILVFFVAFGGLDKQSAPSGLPELKKEAKPVE